MKKKVLTIIIASTCGFAFAQKHVQGMKDVLIGGGKSDLGYYGEIGFNKVASSKVKFGATLLYESAKYKTAKFNTVYLMPELKYAPINIKSILYINAGLGLVANYSGFQMEGFAKKNDLNYGFELLIEPEIYISQSFIV